MQQRNTTGKRAAALFTAFLLFWVMVVSSLPLSTQVQAETTATTTDVVNLRSGPGTSYAVVTTLAQGTKLTVTDTSNSKWYKVKTPGGNTGYVSTSYLKVASSSGTSLGTATTTDYLNLRKGAGTSYSIVTTIAKGTKVTILEKTNSKWYKVKTSSNKTGYVSTEYLNIVSGDSSGSSDSENSSSGTSLGTATTTDYLNLRKGAGTSYSIVTTIAKGAKVTILEKTSSKWYKVKTSSNKTGYVSTEYLKVTSSSSSGSSGSGSSSSETSLGTATTTDYLNLRKGAGTSYSIVTTIAKGAKVTILEKTSSKWYKVKTSSNKTGYVSTEYLKVTSSSSSGSSSSGSSSSGTSLGTATTTDYLNLRKGAGTSYAVVTTLSKDAKLTILDKSNSKWYKVQTASGKVGYVSTEYLKILSSGEPVSGGDSLGTAVTTDYLNLRSGAGTSYSIVTTLATGTSLTILDMSNSKWYKVRTASNKTGYVSTEYIKVIALNGDDEPAEETNVKLNVSGRSMETGDTYTLKATVSNGDGTKPSAASSNKAVATVVYKSASSNVYSYTIKAVGAGSATITVTLGSIKKTMKVTVSEPAAAETKYAQTTTGLNLRKGPGTSYDIITTLPSGTILTILDETNAGWPKVQTSGGYTGYVSDEYIKYVSGSSGAITLSHTSVKIPQGKTMYTTATAANSGSVILWSSSNPSVATVNNGYIYAVSKGTATITATDTSGKNKATCSVTVTNADPVKFVYASPNTVGVNTPMELVAITDTSRSAVKFVVETESGGTKEYTVTSYKSDTNEAAEGMAENATRVWKQKVTFSKAGSYSVKVYSKNSSGWSSGYEEMEAFVVSTTDKTTTAYGERRISDEMLQIIASFEGYSKGVYADALAYGIPTTGYGYVVSKGEQFYNNMTKTEAWALLCTVTNQRSYTTEVNKFVSNNNLKVSQSQFDAMVSFSYNVGAGYWNNSSAAFDLRTIILNSVDVSNLSFGSGRAAKMTASANLYTNIGDSKAATSTYSGASVTVLAAKHNTSDQSTWYQVKLQNGNKYWVRAGYVQLSSTSGLVYDLAYTDSVAFGSEMLAWHVAGGNCIPGLLYRRLAEAKIFSFANYAEADMSNANYRVNTYGYIYPSCMAKYEQ